MINKGNAVQYVKARKDGAVSGPAQLADIARKNAFRLIVVLFLENIVWFVLNRVFSGEEWSFFLISQFNIEIFLLMTIIAFIFIAFSKFSVRFVNKFHDISVGYWFIPAIFLTAIIGNAASSIFLLAGARYSEGGLTGGVGVIYAIAKAASLMAMTLSIRAKYCGSPKIGLAWLALLIASLLATIDGLATALTICMFLFIMMDTRGLKGAILVVIAACIGVPLLYIGFMAKFTVIPSYITPEFSFHWAVARMSISSESLYKYLAGESMFSESGVYIDVLKDTYFNRFQVITGGIERLVYPRSVSEGFYMDMSGVSGAGSSPGFYLGLILNGIFSPLMLFIFVWIFAQFFFGFRSVISYPRMYAISFVLKSTHANVTEYLIIFSPVLVAFVGFIVASMVKVRPKNRARKTRQTGDTARAQSSA